MPIELLAEKNEPPLSLRWLFFGAAGVIVILLFYLGRQPMAVGLFPEPWDKLAHLAVFGSIAALLWFATPGWMPLRVIGVIGAIAAIGALDEWHQGGLAGRSMDYLDFLADVGAAIITVTVLSLAQKW